MTGDRWTFLVLRDGGSPLRQFSVARRTVHYGVGAVTALVLLAGSVTVRAGIDGTSWVHAQRLERENVALVRELDSVRDHVDRLETDLRGLSQQDDRFRTLAGLDPIDAEVYQVGIGGPGTPSPREHPLSEIDPELGEAAFAMRYDLDALERRARLLSESLSEATDSLQAHRELLESTPSILPTRGWISSRFTSSRRHPIHNRTLPHQGVDIAAPRGTPILAAASGVVTISGRDGGYGLMVEIDHGYGFTTRYGHASRLLVRRGERVRRGDVIAHVGQTGLATSSHLHYEVRVNGDPQNPVDFLLNHE